MTDLTGLTLAEAHAGVQQWSRLGRALAMTQRKMACRAWCWVCASLDPTYDYRLVRGLGV